MTAQTSDVVVIGAGIAGLSAAYELARSGASVTVLERGRAGAAASSLNAGGFRSQFVQPPNIKAAKANVVRLLAFQDEFGVDVGLTQVGYLFVYRNEDAERRLQAATATQNGLGVPTRMISLDEVRELAPELRTDDLRGGCYGPGDGYLDPARLMAGLTDGARRLGVGVREGTEVIGIKADGRRVTSVETKDGSFQAATVVNAAGPWAPAIAAMYGESLPVAARRSQVFVIGSTPGVSRKMPFTFDAEAFAYIRVDGQGTRHGWALKAELPEPPATVDPDWSEAEELHRRVAHRVPALAGTKFDRAWAGIIEVTPDDNPIIGWTHLENLYTDAGYSGHGLCIALGLARAVASEISTRQPVEELDFFRIERFSGAGEHRPEGMWGISRPSRLDEVTAEK